MKRANGASSSSSSPALTFDLVYTSLGGYGAYQIFCIVAVQLLNVCHAASLIGSFVTLGKIEPRLECLDWGEYGDENGTLAAAGNGSSEGEVSPACFILRHCANISISRTYYSQYEEFGWACEPRHIVTTVVSVLPVFAVAGQLCWGLAADYAGRKWVVCAGVTAAFVCAVSSALATGTTMYFTCVVLGYLFHMGNPILSLLQESVPKKWRFWHGFALHWGPAFVVCGLLAGWLRHWRHFLLVANSLAVPVIAALVLGTVESPRWLCQRRRFAEAAKCVNWIARVNRSPHRYTTAHMASINLGSRKNAKVEKLTFVHLFATPTLALYTCALVLVSISINTILFVIMMNIDSLAGSPFVNTSLLGLSRLWTPPVAVLLEHRLKWFGRRNMLVAALGTVSACFFGMMLIHVADRWHSWHAFASAFGIVGYALNFGLVYASYKQLVVEIYPTSMRGTALGALSIAAMGGTVAGAQFTYLKHYWFPLPYAGAAGLCLLSAVVSAAALPETRHLPLFDTLRALKAASGHRESRKGSGAAEPSAAGSLAMRRRSVMHSTLDDALMVMAGQESAGQQVRGNGDNDDDDPAGDDGHGCLAGCGCGGSHGRPAGGRDENDVRLVDGRRS